MYYGTQKSSGLPNPAEQALQKASLFQLQTNQ
jgi:hypothetical protein